MRGKQAFRLYVYRKKVIFLPKGKPIGNLWVVAPECDGTAITLPGTAPRGGRIRGR